MRKETFGATMLVMSRPDMIRVEPTSSRRRFWAQGLLIASVFTGSIATSTLEPAVSLMNRFSAPTLRSQPSFDQFFGCAQLRLGHIEPVWVRIVGQPNS